MHMFKSLSFNARFMTLISKGAGLLSIGVCVALASCATLSKQECITGNWEAIGYGDGVAGRAGDRLLAHNKACAKAGIAPDYNAWVRGRQKGLAQYCTESNAYNIGSQGHYLNGVCSSGEIGKLTQANADGRQYYALTRQLRDETSKLKQYREELEKLRNGNNLKFSTERQAREYMIGLPNKIRLTNTRINNLKRTIEQTRSRY